MSCIQCLNCLDVQKEQVRFLYENLSFGCTTEHFFPFFSSLLNHLQSLNSFFLCSRDNSKLPYMVSKNPDKLHNSSWGPHGKKRLILKHSLNIKENHISLLIMSKRISFREGTSMSLSDIIEKTSTIGRLSMVTKTFVHDSYLLNQNCSCVQNGMIQLRNSSLLLCIQKNTLRNSTSNFLWHSRKFLLCCIRHSWLKNMK